MRRFHRFLIDRRGATAVEYGLIVGVLSLAIVGGLSQATNSMTGMFNNIGATLDASWTD